MADLTIGGGPAPAAVAAACTGVAARGDVIAVHKLIAATAVVLAACGGTSSVSPADYPDALRDAYCRYYVNCGDVASVEACRQLDLGTVFQMSASEQAAFDMGKIKFDGGHAQACADAIALRACDLTSQSARAVIDACFTIAVGTLHDGEACGLADECVSQLCDVPSCGMACCAGTCVGDTAPVRAKVGEPCMPARCEDAAFCDAALTCVARKRSGAACTVADECEFGLDCDPSAGCTTLPRTGDSCTGACRDEGTRCSSTTGRCVKAAVEGQPCQMTSDCSRFYVCDATQHCSAGLAVGAACRKSDRCAGVTAFCNIADGEIMGSCALALPLGATCPYNEACESRTCDPTSRQCVDAPVCI